MLWERHCRKQGRLHRLSTPVKHLRVVFSSNDCDMPLADFMETSAGGKPWCMHAPNGRVAAVHFGLATLHDLVPVTGGTKRGHAYDDALLLNSQHHGPHGGKVQI